MDPQSLFLIYGLPVSLAAVIYTLACRRDSPAPCWLSPALAIAWLIGFYALEGLWPWRTLPITRAIHWLPVGIVATASLCWLLEQPSLKRRWVMLALLAIGTLFGWLMLRKFLFKVNGDWTDGRHLLLAVGLMLGSWIHVLGLSGLSRRLPAWASLGAVGVLGLGATLVCFQAASSAKMAQLASVGAAMAGCLALLALRRGPIQSGAASGWLWGITLTFPLLYAIYAADAPQFWPLAPLLAAPMIGLPWIFRKTPRQPNLTGIQLALVLGFIGVMAATATALAFLLTVPEGDEDDVYDAYAMQSGEFTR